MASTQKTAPEEMCSGCPHAAHPGSKCSVCDHVGKGRCFQLVQQRGPKNSTLHFEAFDTGTCDAAKFTAMFAYARIMRERIFVSELHHVNVKTEFDDVDASSRHVFGFIGDAPVAYLRWRVFEENKMRFALIERILVLKTHRQRGIGTRLIAFALGDVVQKLQQLGIPIFAIVVHCPESDYLPRLFQKFGFRGASDAFMDRSQRTIRMVVTPQSVQENAVKLSALLTAGPPLGGNTGVTDRPAGGAAVPAPVATATGAPAATGFTAGGVTTMS